MVLLNQVVQVLRQAQLRARGQQAIGFQLAHRTVRCSVAVQRDCLRGALLAFERFAKEPLGGRDVALVQDPAAFPNGFPSPLSGRPETPTRPPPLHCSSAGRAEAAYDPAPSCVLMAIDAPRATRLFRNPAGRGTR